MRAPHRITARNYAIFSQVVVHQRKLRDVGTEFGLSRERIRQIACKEVRQAQRRLGIPYTHTNHGLVWARDNAALLQLNIRWERDK